MNPWSILSGIMALGVVYVLLPVVLEAFFRYRLRKQVRCPVTREEAWVLVHAPRAGLSAAFGRASLRVRNCSLWPPRDNCGRDCLALREMS